MELTEEQQALKDSPELAEFHNVLTLFSYDSVAFVSAGTTNDDKIARAVYATQVAKAAAYLVSPDCGAGCYWDPEIGTCVCSQIAAEVSTGIADVAGKKKTFNKPGKPGKKKKKAAKGKKSS
jgi:hypothetical protein